MGVRLTTVADDEPTRDDDRADGGDDMVRRAVQRYGAVGGFLAGGMVVFDRLLGRKPQEEAAVVAEASGEPGDIDTDGITIVIDESTTVVCPPPRATRARRVRRRRRRGEGLA